MASHRTPESEHRKLLEYVAEYGPAREPLAAHLGIPWNTLDTRIKALGPRYRECVDSWKARMAAQREVAPPPSRRKIEDILQIPPAPFAVPIPAPARKASGRFITAVLYGDTHIPFADPAAVKVVQAVVRDVKPDILVNMGDLVDCWQISRFDKDPTRLDTLQDNIDAAKVHLHEMAQIAPQARRVLLEGNHETRLTRTIHKMAGEQRALAQLRDFQQALKWPGLLDLAGVGFEWVPERDQSRTQILPRGITKHGSVVRKWSGWSARGEWEKYGRSGFSGHTHRLGWFTHRDHNGHASWVETGCTCLLDAPYGVDFDWGHGCVVVTWSKDEFIMNVEFVSVREGRAIWRTQEYDGSRK